MNQGLPFGHAQSAVVKVHGVFLFTPQTGRLADWGVAKHHQTAVGLDMSPRDEASARSRPGESISWTSRAGNAERKIRPVMSIRGAIAPSRVSA